MILVRALCFVFVLLALGCSRSQKAGADAEPRGAPKPELEVPATPAVEAKVVPRQFVPGDAAHGKELVQKFECSRCHAGTDAPAASFETHCVDCHKSILKGTFPAAADKLAKWQKNVGYVRAVPSLSESKTRFDRAWLYDFLLKPNDLRPLLEPSMPRLGLSESDARDIATYLGRESDARAPSFMEGTDAKRGRHLLEQRACGTCHRFSGVEPLPQMPDPKAASADDAVLLAPDLRHTRLRWSAESLVGWLRDPRAVKADTLMPATGLSAEQARDAARYILETPLSPRDPAPQVQRLPVLERRVSFSEVDERVLRVTCRHCHGNPDVALGDGGPGNTGGFGFKGRGVDLSSYTGVLSGYVDDKGERRSLFEETADGLPRLLAALLARHDEQGDGIRADVRGMPLGLPAVSLEAIQLVESWIAQGRPR